MARPGQITVTPVRVPSVLVVLDAAWPELFARCLGAAVRSGVLVHRCEVAAAATFAAEKRPLAIVLSNAVYDLDPDEFEALARDVRAALLKVDEEITERELEAMFSAALRERERREDTGTGSRYTLIGQVQSEETGPRSTRPPVSVRQTQAPPSARSVQLAGLRPSQAPPPDAPPPSARSMQLAGLRPSQAPAASAPVPEPPPPSVRAPLPPRSSPTQPSFAAPASSPTPRPEPPPPSARAPLPPRSSPTQPSFAAPAPSSRPVPPAPPPPSVRSGAATPVPGSVRAPLPAPPRSTTPTPGSLPPPPSVRGAQLATPAGPPSGVPRPQGPASVRAPQLAKAAPTDPRSGVRYGGDALDAVFEDQDLPNGTRVRGGS